MRAGHLRDLVGFGCFLFAACISTGFAWQSPSILAWLYAIHNTLLAFFYARRRPAKACDRKGLWLGIMAAFLPTWSTVGACPWYLLMPALAGYALILWSLFTLGPRFGIAPADRGLTASGPYRLIRHPMYLGEVVFRLAMVACSPEWFSALFLASLLVCLQVWRIFLEEKVIAGYGCYSRLVPWRLIPGIW
jgi:hypothetical protein